MNQWQVSRELVHESWGVTDGQGDFSLATWRGLWPGMGLDREPSHALAGLAGYLRLHQASCGMRRGRIDKGSRLHHDSTELQTDFP